jgi:hypothetical protein
VTFLDKYKEAATWYDKAAVMEIYHLAMCQRDKTWTVGKTAQYFECSIGLVSENLKLAHHIHSQPKLLKISTRQDALRKIR